MSLPESSPGRRRAARVLALVLGLLFAPLAAEAVLRLSGAYTTYSERNYGTYHDVFGRTMPGWIHSWVPGESRVFETAEFRYDYAVNDEGVRDVPHALEAEPGRRRVVVLGDSYVEGVGADQHEAWPAVMGGMLADAGVDVEVLNAGMSGSDPWFEYQLFRERFLRYRPDLVVVSINNSDIYDLVWWGGRERFLEDGTTRGRPRHPSFEYYRRSHLARWYLHTFAGMDRSTFAYGEPGRVAWDAQLGIVAACQAIDALRSEHDFELLVVVHPVPHGILVHGIPYFDAFFQRLGQSGIPAVNLTEALCAQLDDLELEEYAWPIDCHYNARGYQALARAVTPHVLERLAAPSADATSR